MRTTQCAGCASYQPRFVCSRVCRPDICHQVLLALLDSPLNKAGLLQVYISTAKGVLIEINPEIRIPRTFRRFCGLMVQLLHKLKIRTGQGSQRQRSGTLHCQCPRLAVGVLPS